MHHASLAIGTHDDRILWTVWNGRLRKYANVSIAKASILELCLSGMRSDFTDLCPRTVGRGRRHCTPPRLNKSAP